MLAPAAKLAGVMLSVYFIGIHAVERGVNNETPVVESYGS